MSDTKGIRSKNSSQFNSNVVVVGDSQTKNILMSTQQSMNLGSVNEEAHSNEEIPMTGSRKSSIHEIKKISPTK